MVLALHGWGRRGTDFAASLQGFAYIALDLPGFGASPAPERPQGARGYAEAVAPVLTEMALRPILVGHSFGGRVAVVLAARYPDMVGGVILSGVPLIRRSGSRKGNRVFRALRWGHKVGLISGPTMERIRRRYGSVDYRAASGVMRQTLVATVNESYEEELAAIRAPVHLLWGEADTEVPPRVAVDAADLMKSAGVEVTLEVLAGVGHWLPTEAPAALNRAVRAMFGNL